MSLNVLTIATGKKLYLDMAVNLARSFRWWNRSNDINFYLATDMADQLPADVKSYTNIIALKPEELGKGFSPKLHLDKIAPSGQTIFIDSDCLVYGDLRTVFEKFKGHAVSVVGNYIADGDWFGDISVIARKFNIAHLPKFNGGVYYLEQGPIAKKIYQQARDLEASYDDIGFVRLRGRANDEVLMALSMQANGQAPIPEDGSILGEFVNFASGVKSDLLNGEAILYNKPTHKNYQPNWPLTEGRPLIVHFLGHHNQQMPYLKEVHQLKLVCEGGMSPFIARAITALQISIPVNTRTALKDIFRPVYRAIWGVRDIKTSERIIN